MQSYGVLDKYDIADDETPVVTTMTEEFFKALSPEQIEKIIEKDYTSEVIYIMTSNEEKIRAQEFFKKSYIN